MKIFLTGDNHLGLKYSGHERAAELAEARMAAFPGMVAAANAEGCGLFVIAGDLFENTQGIAKKEMKRLLTMLSGFEGTVIILPGNHDYYDRELKVWQNMEELLPSFHNIMLLNRYRAYELEVGGRRVLLYPAFCTSKHSEPGENNLGWIKKAEMPEDAVKIGIAHGAVEGETIDSEGRYFLMSRRELEETGVDCWLIGHTHVPFPDKLSDSSFSAGGKIFNAGTHVQTDLSCRTEGQCFIISIDDKRKISAKKFVSGRLHFYRKNVDVSGKRLEEALSAALEGIDDFSVVDLILSGALCDEDYDGRSEIIEKALSRFLEGTYRDSRLSRLISQGLIEREYPETSFSYAFLSSLLDEPKEAQLAYELLQSLKEER